MNPFCRFLLKSGVKAGKNYSRLEFTARTLADSQFRDAVRPETIPGNAALGH
jgi:hypothetical protein